MAHNRVTRAGNNAVNELSTKALPHCRKYLLIVVFAHETSRAMWRTLLMLLATLHFFVK